MVVRILENVFMGKISAVRLCAAHVEAHRLSVSGPPRFGRPRVRFDENGCQETLP
jgi:hypothetical protein